MSIERELTISYGGYSVGGKTGRHPVGKVRVDKGYTETTVMYSFLVTGNSASAFASACYAAEKAFRKPNQSLYVSNDGSTLLSLRNMNNAFDGAPTLIKGEDPGDTGRSRIYTARVVFGMAADTKEEEADGLRSSSVDVSYSPSRRRTVNISGVFTAIDGEGSRAQYDAKIEAFTAAVLSSLTGTFEIISQSDEHNSHDTLLEFNQTFREIIFDQGSSGTLDDAAIVEQHLKITRAKENTKGHSPYGEAGYAGDPVDPLTVLEVSYDADIDHNETTELPAKWSEIKQWILSSEVPRVLSAEGDGADFAVMVDSVTYYNDDNRISARMIIHAVGSTDAIEHTITVTDDLEVGGRFVGVWTGNPLEKYHYQGPATARRTVTESLVWNGPLDVHAAAAKSYSAHSGFADAPPFLASPHSGSGLRFILINRSTSATPKQWGVGENTLNVTEIKATSVFEIFKPYENSGGASTGGGGGGVVPTEPSGSSGGGSRTNTPSEGRR